MFFSATGKAKEHVINDKNIRDNPVWTSSSSVSIQPCSYPVTKPAGVAVLRHLCPETICISIGMLLLEQHVTMESVCLE